MQPNNGNVTLHGIVHTLHHIEVVLVYKDWVALILKGFAPDAAFLAAIERLGVLWDGDHLHFACALVEQLHRAVCNCSTRNYHAQSYRVLNLPEVWAPSAAAGIIPFKSDAVVRLLDVSDLLHRLPGVVIRMLVRQ